MASIYVMCDNADQIPLKATEGAAGYDIKSTKDLVLGCSPCIYTMGTGVSIQMPPDYCGLLMARSSLHQYGLSLANGVGLIDSDFRGEIKLKLKFDGFVFDENLRVVKAGTRLAQIVFFQLPHTVVHIIKKLEESSRGNGSFGSTGE